MKKNYLCSGFLALSLLLAYPCETQSVDDVKTPAETAAEVAAVHTATNVIKSSFDINGRHNDVVSYAQFIDAMKLFNPDFAKFPYAATSMGLYECVKTNLESFPPALREIFEKISYKEFDVIIRERKALEYFFKNFLTCPVTKVPTWQTLSNNMIPLLEGNTLLFPFQRALKETKDASGSIIGKMKIKNALDKPEVKGCIPKPIVQKLDAIKGELPSRVKC